MNVGSIGTRSQLSVQALVDMRRRLDDLQRQLGTGKKSTTYAGLGIDRGLATGLRAQLSAIESYDHAITLVDVRLDLSRSVLGRMLDIRSSAKGWMQQPPDIRANGQSPAQTSARSLLDEMLQLLNTQAGDRFLFAGREVAAAAVESTAHVLDGDGARAGLRQIIAERALADLGASGLGRLATSVAGGTLTLAEDAAGSPFGFKLAAANATLSGATITGPSGTPPSVAVALAANPNVGESITFALDLPDGTQQALTLAASTAVPPAAGEFTIGPDPDTTATNLQTALGVALANAAKTALVAASAVAASEDFFAIDAGDPPLRVGGPPFETATALVAGTVADTVFWYTGEMSTAPARSSASARVDDAIAINYGLRANEEGIRALVQNVAAFAAISFDPNDASAPAAYAELTGRLAPALSGAQGVQRIEDIAADLAAAQVTLNATSARHQQNRHVVGGLLEEIESVPTEQVAAEILALQTRLQASLQTTALLSQLSLADYL
ncbi:MAG TPA: flagellar biosynthesis protein FlgL [Xanthobacteraceae bacterium]|nr:flagellar biosynthesis protein FlgL [Xanthobacteraceae bacterium]